MKKTKAPKRNGVKSTPAKCRALEVGHRSCECGGEYCKPNN